jgi:hypothetical protein
MRYPTALLLFLVVCVAAAQETSVAVFLESDHNAPALVLNSLQREVEDAVGPSGIHIYWHAMEASQFTQVYERIAKVRLRGDCRANALPSGSAKSEPLGETQVVEGKVLPIAIVRCDSVRRLIGRTLLAAHFDQRDELLGRALGRVMAHELFHILLRTTDHGRDGLARAAQSSGDLVADRRRFREREEKRLSEPPTVDAGGSPESGR